MDNDNPRTRTWAYRREQLPKATNEQREDDTNVNTPVTQHPDVKRRRLFAQKTKDHGNGNIDHNLGKKLHPVLTPENLALLSKEEEDKRSTFSTSEPSIHSTTTRSSDMTPYRYLGFQNGLLSVPDSRAPINLQDICESLTRPIEDSLLDREILQNMVYPHHYRAVTRAISEMTITIETSARLLKAYPQSPDSWYGGEYSQPCTVFPKQVGFNDGLPMLTPDFIEGFRARVFHPFPIENIEGAVLHRDSPHPIVLPHIAGEWKRKGGNLEDAEFQAAHAGAAMVYARNQALAYIGRPDPPGVAQVLTFCLDGTFLRIFAHYAATENGRTEYHQYTVKEMGILYTFEGFEEGRRWLRNMQEYAEKQSIALVKGLKSLHGI